MNGSADNIALFESIKNIEMRGGYAELPGKSGQFVIMHRLWK